MTIKPNESFLVRINVNFGVEETSDIIWVEKYEVTDSHEKLKISSIVCVGD